MWKTFEMNRTRERERVYLLVVVSEVMTTSPPFSQTLAHIIQDDGHRNGHGQNRSDDDARLESLVLRFRY
jgi:hypothetical protein